MLSSGHEIINQRINLLACNIENINAYLAILNKIETDCCGRVEWVRWILVNTELRNFFIFNRDNFIGDYTFNRVKGYIVCMAYVFEAGFFSR